MEKKSSLRCCSPTAIIFFFLFVASTESTYCPEPLRYNPNPPEGENHCMMPCPGQVWDDKVRMCGVYVCVGGVCVCVYVIISPLPRPLLALSHSLSCVLPFHMLSLSSPLFLSRTLLFLPLTSVTCHTLLQWLKDNVLVMQGIVSWVSMFCCTFIIATWVCVREKRR